MATWKVTPLWKKSIIERQEWLKDDQRLIVEIGKNIFMMNVILKLLNG